MDVIPAVLDCLGLPAPEHLDGRSLLHPLDSARAVYLEASGGALGPVQGLRTARHKYLRAIDPPHGEMLFDLLADPAERDNHAPVRPDRVAALRTRLDALLENSQPTSWMSPEEEAALARRLRELGYLE